MSHVLQQSLKDEGGNHHGYPKYIEQNKHDGTKFGHSVKPAEIVYCADIGSWVFKHPDIFTAPIDSNVQNECDWLWRSPHTHNYDISTTTDGAWEAWTGEVKLHAQVSVTCNQCSEHSDCNYHGTCKDKKCVCGDSHFGESCEFESPCTFLASEKAHTLGES